MKIKFYFLLLFLAFFSSSWAQNKTAGSIWEVLAYPVHAFRLNRQQPAQAERQRIQYGPEERQYLWLYEPLGGAKQAPIIFYVHGGAWRTGKPEQHQHLAQLFTDLGYRLVMPAYRLAPTYCQEDLQLDIDQAILAALKHWNISGPKSQWIIGGSSAGGNLAALLAYDQDRLKNLGLSTQNITGFFSIAGALDLNQMESSLPLRQYAGSNNSVNFKLANPIYLIDPKDDFPALLLHGNKDGLVDFRASASFAQSLNQAQLPYSFHCIRGASHLVVTAKWYYKTKKRKGQGQHLRNWLIAISKAEIETPK
ncbi:alpha/beta hydrolase [Saprospira sp. CCB-QB6]|uniref:alpha/beta hydrolase n=1 Tax=Saprospira sp. CCB-QB6 TaxID=3023936 RepID=UPI00234AAB67|nr:alpha/beta hydrolase [Saprospira sp. CCB-QB6]WCL80410.1 alpha/beta hydrolase [Saprospira sp. CCB-QB6]